MWPDLLIARMAALDADAADVARWMTEGAAPTSAQAVRAWLHGARPAPERWDALLDALRVSEVQRGSWVSALCAVRREVAP